jgi:hypothetical protein
VMLLCLSCSARFLRFLSTSSSCRLGVCCLSMVCSGCFWSMLMSSVLSWILIWRASTSVVVRVISPCFSVCIRRVSVCCGFSVGRVFHFFCDT